MSRKPTRFTTHTPHCHYFRVRGFLRPRASPRVASSSSPAALVGGGAGAPVRLPALAALAALTLAALVAVVAVAALVALVALIAVVALLVGTLGGLPAAAAWACASSRTVLATLQNSGP